MACVVGVERPGKAHPRQCPHRRLHLVGAVLHHPYHVRRGNEVDDSIHMMADLQTLSLGWSLLTIGTTYRIGVVDCVPIAIAGLLNIGKQVFYRLREKLDLQYQIVGEH